MPTIAITSCGTLGDNLPLIALGKSLKQRGHDVLMVISEPMHPYALKAGLNVAANGVVLGQRQAKQESQAWNHFRKKPSIDESFYEKFRCDLANKLDCLLDACKNIDIIISTPQQNIFAAIACDKLDIPWARTSVTPSLHCREPKSGQAYSSEDNNNYAKFDKKFYLIVEDARKSLDLPPLSPTEWEQYFICKKLLLGSSCHFSQPATKYPYAVQTGFWFYEEPEWQNWQPDSELKNFMTQESKPLVLSFSSQPLTDEEATAVVKVHVRAAAKLNRPILIQQGWADFTADLLPEDCDRDRVMFAGFMPQDWLFSHAAALIHHGGIGTTARALRNGCPMLVEPYGNDQFFNAKQIVFHGVGAAIHPMDLQVDELTRVLRNKVLTSGYKQRAVKMGAKIRQEAGLETACDIVQNWLQGSVAKK